MNIRIVVDEREMILVVHKYETFYETNFVKYLKAYK